MIMEILYYFMNWLIIIIKLLKTCFVVGTNFAQMEIVMQKLTELICYTAIQFNLREKTQYLSHINSRKLLDAILVQQHSTSRASKFLE